MISRVLRLIRDKLGIRIVLVEQNLDMVMALAERRLAMEEDYGNTRRARYVGQCAQHLLI